MRRLAAAAVLAWAATAQAHVGSPHVYAEAQAGPYSLLVFVDMPPAIPGEATVQVRVQDQAAGEALAVRVREIPPSGEAQAPPWVDATRDRSDPAFYTAPMPLIVFGLWHVAVEVKGARGEGLLTLPVTARTAASSAMGTPLAVLLAALSALLVISLWRIAGAVGADAARLSGAGPRTPADLRRGRLWALGATLAFSAILAFNFVAWHLLARLHRRLSRPPIASRLENLAPAAAAGTKLDLALLLANPDGSPVADIVPDHGKMMHALVVKSPELSYLYHVHPRLVGPGRLSFAFTPPEPGTYLVFADVLRASGQGETLTHRLEITPGRAYEPPSFGDADDSQSSSPALDPRALGRRIYDVGQDLRLRWLLAPDVRLRAGQVVKLEFQLERSDGVPAEAMEPYMGMAGHLLVMSADAQVFMHVHPMGTVPGAMPAGMVHAGMSMDMPMHEHPLPPRVSFPFGFPRPGVYRMWVQVKHHGRVLSGVFDTEVGSSD